MYFGIGDYKTVDRIVYLQTDLQEYLATLAGRFPRKFTSLVRLSRLDRDDEHVMYPIWLRTLVDDLSEMITRLDSDPTPFGPPEIIGADPGVDVRMKFGPTGLRQWATDLRAIALLALERDLPLIAVGD